MSLRSPSQQARDQRRIGELYLKGWRQVDIAAELHIAQGTVSKALKILQVEWRKEAIADIDEMKSRELAKIDSLERTYWTAWERSTQDAQTQTKRMKGRGHGGANAAMVADEMEQIDQTRGQAGEPRFLAGVLECIRRRCELLGIDAPKKEQTTGEYVITVVRRDMDASGNPLAKQPSPKQPKKKIRPGGAASGAA